MTGVQTCALPISIDEPERPGQLLDLFAQLEMDDRILFASDYPHGDCDFPNSVIKLRRRKDISDSLKENILSNNPARLYGI